MTRGEMKHADEAKVISDEKSAQVKADRQSHHVDTGEATLVGQAKQTAQTAFGRVAGTVESTDAKIQHGLEGETVQNVEVFADRLFLAMGLQATDKFLCCLGPEVFSLRLAVYSISLLQTMYGVAILLMALGMVLVDFIRLVSGGEIPMLIALGIVFISELIIGGFYFCCGLYGIRATFSAQKVQQLEDRIIGQTHFHYKLYLVGYISTTILTVVVAIFYTVMDKFSGASRAFVWAWAWAVVHIFVSGYLLYICWSYTTWIIAAKDNPEALSKATKLTRQDGKSSRDKQQDKMAM